MKTLVFVLAMLGTTTAGHAYPAYLHEWSARAPAENMLGLHDMRPPATIPSHNGYDCNGGPCSLTGGPSGGPNQT